jgi:hypothetical protein
MAERCPAILQACFDQDQKFSQLLKPSRAYRDRLDFVAQLFRCPNQLE